LRVSCTTGLVEALAPTPSRASVSRRGAVAAAVASTALVALGVFRLVDGATGDPARPMRTPPTVHALHPA